MTWNGSNMKRKTGMQADVKQPRWLTENVDFTVWLRSDQCMKFRLHNLRQFYPQFISFQTFEFFVLNLILSDLAILYRFVLQNVKAKYYPTPSGNRTQAPWLQFQHAPFWATEACAT